MKSLGAFAESLDAYLNPSLQILSLQGQSVDLQTINLIESGVNCGVGLWRDCNFQFKFGAQPFNLDR